QRLKFWSQFLFRPNLLNFLDYLNIENVPVLKFSLFKYTFEDCRFTSLFLQDIPRICGGQGAIEIKDLNQVATRLRTCNKCGSILLIVSD
ncbi:MAG TPA: hypothetical protein PLS33_11260, partial [Smithella sp.]|nr:hypothetical protein [Smithella sp.]